VRFDNCIALLRIYVAWIYSQQEDIVAYSEHLQPYIDHMHRALTKCISLFINAIGSQDWGTFPYLFQEDVEVIGMSPLDKWVGVMDPTRSVMKPRLDRAPAEVLGSLRQRWGRAYDVVQIAVMLIQDPNFPWTVVNEMQGTQQVSRVIFSESCEPLFDGQATNTQATPQAPEAPWPQHVQQLHSLYEPNTSPQGQVPTASPFISADLSPVGRQWATGQAIRHATPVQVEHQYVPLSDADLEFGLEAFEKFGEFLEPPKSKAEEALRPDGDESSYGMHSATAESIFGGIPTRNPVTSPNTSNPFSGLPGSTIWTPAPKQHAADDALGSPTWSQGFAGRTSGSPVTSAYGAGSTDLSAAFASRSSPKFPDVSRGFPNVTPPESANMSNGSHKRASSYGSQRGPRDFASRNAGPSTITSGATFSTPTLGRGASQASIPGNRALNAPSSLSAKRGRGLEIRNNNTEFSSTNFTTTSSLPSVHSPRGLPMARQSPPRLFDPNAPYHTTKPATSPMDREKSRKSWGASGSAKGRNDTVPRGESTRSKSQKKSEPIMIDADSYDRHTLISPSDKDKSPHR